MSSTAIREARHFTTSGRTEYLTPKHVIDAIGPFDLDPCASVVRPCASVVRPWPTAAKHYTKYDDGLAQSWEGFVWLNPPFGKAANGCACEGKCDCHDGDGNACEPSEDHPDCDFSHRQRAWEIDWVRKLSLHPGGGILLSSPAKAETKMWQEVVLPRCSGILLLTPRLRFCNTDGSAMSGTFGATALVAFGDIAMDRLLVAVQRGRLEGRVVVVLYTMGARGEA